MQYGEAEVEDTAYLTNSVVENRGGGCLVFWYHMYGEHVGTLDATSSIRGEVLYSLDTAQNDQRVPARLNKRCYQNAR